MLSEIEREYVVAVGRGESARAYAGRLGYSRHWAKWMSRKIRTKLGVESIEEAWLMSEMTAEDVAALRREIRELKEAQARLEAARTPAAREAAREDVREARSDLDSELRERGLTRADLDKLQEEKDYAKFKERQSRYEQERAEAEAAAAEEEAASKPKRKPAPKAVEPQEEEPPKTTHWSERSLFRRKGEDD